MNCENVQHTVLRGDEATEDERIDAQRHIERCSACKAFASDFALVRKAATSDTAAPSPLAMRAVLEAGRARLDARSRLRFPVYSRVLAAAAAALLAMAGASLLVLPGARETERQAALDAMLALTDADETRQFTPGDDATPEERIEALSHRLLLLQGFDAEPGLEDVFFTIDFEERPAPGTQGRRNDGGDFAREQRMAFS